MQEAASQLFSLIIDVSLSPSSFLSEKEKKKICT
jgi:hypothetical protein